MESLRLAHGLVGYLSERERPFLAILRAVLRYEQLLTVAGEAVAQNQIPRDVVNAWRLAVTALGLPM